MESGHVTRWDEMDGWNGIVGTFGGEIALDYGIGRNGMA